MLSPMDEVAAALNALAAIMRRMPSELRAQFRAEAKQRRLIRARFRAEAKQRRLIRARFRAEAEERKLDEYLDRISDARTADQDDGDAVGAGEDRGPLPPRIDPLFGLLIGILAVLVLIAMLALLPKV
jgi:parvulin-like peptidyl-prolyl isomerase